MAALAVAAASGPAVGCTVESQPRLSTRALQPAAQPGALQPEGPASREATEPFGGSPSSIAFEIPDRGSFGNVPAGIATGSFDSVNRQLWPCGTRMQFHGDDSWKIEWRLVYGKRRRCRLPLEAVDNAIIGCPERLITEHDGRFYDVQRLSYDSRDRLSRIESNFGTELFTWDGDIPHSSDESPSERTEGRITWRLIGESVIDVDERGRALRVWNVDEAGLESRCEYGWTGDRLDYRQCYEGSGHPTWRHEPIYDCRALKRLGRTVNRSGALGVPVMSN